MIRRLSLLIGCCAFIQCAVAAPISTAASGLAAVTAARDTFRTQVGGGNVAGANGSFAGVRREINWDGVPDARSAPNNLPADFFNVNSPRGAVFSTPGTGFQVSATAASGTPIRFGNINATYPTTFVTFSPERLFTALGSNITDVTFFLAGTATPATVSAFGAVFTDVDNANTTSIQFFDTSNNSLGTFFVPASGGDVSFLGVIFDGGERVSRVRITSGNVALGPNDGPPAADVVAMDDFLYSEPLVLLSAPRQPPLPVPALHPAALALIGMTLAGLAGLGIRRRRSTGR